MTPVERLARAIAVWWAPRCKECGAQVAKGDAFCSVEHANAYNDAHAW